jgi:hypothetical protein
MDAALHRPPSADDVHGEFASDLEKAKPSEPRRPADETRRRRYLLVIF